MNCTRPGILCFGRDPMLLDTRRRILEHAGLPVMATTLDLTVAMGLIDGTVSLLILCHTLSHQDKAVMSRFHRDAHSEARLLFLLRSDFDPAPEHRSVFHASKGPAAFVAAVTRLNRLSMTTLLASGSSLIH